MRNRVFVEKVESGKLSNVVRQALEWLDWGSLIPQGARVFLKPNFTYPFYKPGVSTSPQVIEALVSILRERTTAIFIGESDGGSLAWSAEEAFDGHGLPELARRYGVGLVNLSRVAREEASVAVAGRQVRVVLPSMLLREIDVFITLPVPKVHVMTGVSLGFKNQWGCLPDVKRLRYHSEFAHVVLAVHKLLKPRIAFFDGTYFLDRTGPMEGDPVKMDLIVAANDVGAGTLACCEIMQIPPGRIRHLRLAMREGLMPKKSGELGLNQPLESLKQHRFTLQRTLMNWVTLAIFHNSLATRLIYDSKLAGPIHQLIYSVRGKPKDVVPQW
ncbi:MAG: DUF362 domain-containing protein [Acidobacteria bacterium]|nr:DUF362 domain-containing protein [Acidobacteriota bacterium]